MAAVAIHTRLMKLPGKGRVTPAPKAPAWLAAKFRAGAGATIRLERAAGTKWVRACPVADRAP